MTTQYDGRHISIKAWAEEDRPREKLAHLGRSALSNAELIAILIGSGTKEQSAVQVSRQLLAQTNNDLNALGKKSIKELTQIKGIGPAKAISIIAALELGRRRQAANPEKLPKITCSQDVHLLLAPLIEDLPVEEFWVLMLNRANRVINKVCISKGGISGTVVDTRYIFKKALESLASSIILCHNHPSGNLTPSQADHQITKNLIQAGKFLDIAVLDHLVISSEGFYSFADNGEI